MTLERSEASVGELSLWKGSLIRVQHDSQGGLWERGACVEFINAIIFNYPWLIFDI